eukprot:5856343-Lingulodinium_polyedra.AAC.1
MAGFQAGRAEAVAGGQVPGGPSAAQALDGGRLSVVFLVWQVWSALVRILATWIRMPPPLM